MTTRVTIEQAKEKLTELIHSLPLGDELVITENDEAVAKLARTGVARTWPCKAGSAKDSDHWMAPDFDEPLEDFKDYME